MKKSASIILGILMFLVGVLAISANQTFGSRQVVVLGGVLFIIAGFINALTPYLRNKRKKAETDTDAPAQSKAKNILNWVVSGAALILGVVMICMTSVFEPFIPVTFGVFILLGSIVMFYHLAIGIRPVMLPGWMYIFPIALLIAAVLVYFQETPQDDSIVMITTGASACLYGIGSALTTILVAKVSKTILESEASSAQTSTEQPTELQPLNDNE